MNQYIVTQGRILSHTFANYENILTIIAVARTQAFRASALLEAGIDPMVELRQKAWFLRLARGNIE
jgi:hypothetical protein